MESDILDILEQLGYDGPLAEEACLLAECGRGFSSSEYVNLLTWLTKQLTQFTETHTQDEIITADPLDVSRLLKDCCCPYEGLASRLANGDVKDTRDHLKIILFVSSELQSAQLLLSKTLRDAEEREMRSCSPLQDLSVICHTLTLPDPAGRDPTDTFTDIQTQVNVLLEKLPETHIGAPALQRSISAEQWEELEKINSTLSAEYECRRRMLIKRLDVTVQSFSWSDRAKVKIDQMARAYQPKRHSLSVRSSVSLAHLLAARRDICNMVKTSSGSSRQNTSCAVNRILMGRVPDRGGRPSEIQAPAPEMPTWRRRLEDRKMESRRRTRRWTLLSLTDEQQRHWRTLFLDERVIDSFSY